MTRYRTTIGALEAEGVRHCDELWDLLREIEAGGRTRADWTRR